MVDSFVKKEPFKSTLSDERRAPALNFPNKAGAVGKGSKCVIKVDMVSKEMKTTNSRNCRD